MASISMLRRGVSLLMVGLVFAGSTGLAWHDPDCVHHTGQAGHAGMQVVHHAETPSHDVEGHHHDSPSSESEDDCSCLGFCALAGQVVAVAATAAPTVPAAPSLQDDPLSSVRDEVVAASATLLQPPSTGPPSPI